MGEELLLSSHWFGVITSSSNAGWQKERRFDKLGTNGWDWHRQSVHTELRTGVLGPSACRIVGAIHQELALVTIAFRAYLP
ncbi:MAG: hypothetical protein A4S12_05435 [Proteobacteria bacterium SG_bin5]|nr:MAG: hypothetical protein A4S12_05435 [Proteobacteria bacterium SG_bin5]